MVCICMVRCLKTIKMDCSEKYYVTFPHSAFNIYSLRENRQSISHHENNFFLSYNGETVKDNKCLPFTMFGDDFKIVVATLTKKQPTLMKI